MSILAHDFLRKLKRSGILEVAEQKVFVSFVERENKARLFQKPWDSPVSLLRRSLGTVPVFEILEAGQEPVRDELDLGAGLCFGTVCEECIE